MNPREKGIRRLNNFHPTTSDAYFLHYRSRFVDLKKASLQAKGRLSDIGCGNKPYEKMVTDRITEPIGCDVLQSSANRVDVICPATKLPFDDSSFDTALITQVIEHVADHRAMLSETFRVLKADGTLILSGAMYWPLHEEPYDFFGFAKHGFRFLLETVGFVGINTENNGGKWALCGQVLVHTILGSKFQCKFLIRAINRVFAYLDDWHPFSSNPMN